MKFKYAYISLIMTVLVMSSCLKDTCNGALGNTFNEIEFDSIYVDDSSQVNAHFSLEVLEELPEAYFIAVLPSDSTDLAQTDTLIVNKTSLILTLENSALPAIAGSEDYSLSYVFGDRRTHIECQHPGSSDLYYLEMTFNLMNLDGTNFELTDFEWNEFYVAGHL